MKATKNLVLLALLIAIAGVSCQRRTCPGFGKIEPAKEQSTLAKA